MSVPIRFVGLVWIAVGWSCASSGGDGRGGEDVIVPDDAVSYDGTTGDDTASPDGVVGGLEWLVSMWCEPFASRVCEAARACGCSLAPGFPAHGCEGVALDHCRILSERVARSLEEGRLVLQENALPTCLGLLDEALARCDLPDPYMFSVGCVLFATPVDIGEACEEGLCARGEGYCAPPGHCQVLPGMGEACAASLCARGLRCDEGTCRMPANLGGACERDTQCASGLVCRGGACSEPERVEAALECFDPSSCGKGLHCVATMRRVCAQRPRLGEACLGGECAQGTFCHEGTCVVAPGRGAACGDGLACAPGLACDLATITCSDLPGLGKPCALGRYGPVVCEKGLYCREGVCDGPPGEGESCVQGSDGMPACADGLGCDFRPDGTSVCTTPAGPGAPCTNDSMCLEGLYCDFSMLLCREKQSRGQACSDGNECGPGLTCLAPRVGLGTFCEPVPGLGETCLDTCQDDLVCRAVADRGHCLPGVCTAIPF